MLVRSFFYHCHVHFHYAYPAPQPPVNSESKSGSRKISLKERIKLWDLLRLERIFQNRINQAILKGFRKRPQFSVLHGRMHLTHCVKREAIHFTQSGPSGLGTHVGRHLANTAAHDTNSIVLHFFSGHSSGHFTSSSTDGTSHCFPWLKHRTVSYLQQVSKLDTMPINMAITSRIFIAEQGWK